MSETSERLRRMHDAFWRVGKPAPAALPPSWDGGFDAWIDAATSDLAAEPRMRVYGELREHYRTQRDEFVAQGATTEDASRVALAALGPWRVARRRLNGVYLKYYEQHLIDLVSGRRLKWRKGCPKLDLAYTSSFMVVLGGFYLMQNGAVTRFFEPVSTGAFIFALNSPTSLGRLLYGRLGEPGLRRILMMIGAFQSALAVIVAAHLGGYLLELLFTDRNPLAHGASWFFPCLCLLNLVAFPWVNFSTARKLPPTGGRLKS
jgi:hypothetical protein